MSTREPMTHKIFHQMIATLKSAADAYYNTGSLLMTDQEYDNLTDLISEAIKAHPDWSDAGVLTSVSAGTPSSGDVSHGVPMLSLGKTRTKAEIEDFFKSVGDEALLIEPKIDGLAVRAVYKSGDLVLVATRGDGQTGEDITAAARAISGLPTTLNSKIDIEVRGEVYMTDSDFEIANASRVASGKPAFVNPRNATAGTLRTKERDYFAPMSFSAYDVISDADENSYAAKIKTASDLGISVAGRLIKGYESSISDRSEILRAIDDIGKLRPSLGFPIDGIVLKVDSISSRSKIGQNSHVPKWAIAFKYPADTAITKLLDIEMAIGRTGRLSLRAVLDPVFVGGATVSYATLHHPGFVRDADLRIGDHVFVYRSGDVIPRVTAPNLTMRSPESIPWTPPDNCPQCDSPLNKEGLLWRCETPDCSITGKIRYFADRDIMDIEGIDVSIAEALVDSGLVKSVADLYGLSVEQIATVQTGTLPSGEKRLIGTTVAKKIYSSIQKSKTQPFSRVVASLGIRGTGRVMGRRLASKFKTMNNLRSATISDLRSVEGVSGIKARLILDGLDSMSSVIDRLIAFGVSTKEETAKPLSSTTPLSGKKIVITGSIPGMTRTQGQEAVELLGGTASSSISSSTDLVIVGDGAGSKADKAEKLGVATIDASDFAKMVSDYKNQESIGLN